MIFFFFNAPPTTEIYTLSLHDALPISVNNGLEAAGGDELHHRAQLGLGAHVGTEKRKLAAEEEAEINLDRKSTRLNSSHTVISYAVFCLKKKKKNTK